MISLKELLMGRADFNALSKEIQDNLMTLLERANRVRTAYNQPMTINDGLRMLADQMRVNPSAPKSKHLVGAAMDINDPDGSVWKWVLANLDLMQQIGFWFEHPNWTHHPDGHGWVHFQIFPPASGKRVFIPSSAPAMAPSFWDSKYDSKYDAA